jgi:NAD(P)-dependent dehydrogenase (short-subunit alcohol dehydrogenase family)
MAVNLDGAFLTLRDCARRMIAQGDGGAMVAISSTSAVHGAPANPHYAASKTALLGLVRSAAVGLARHRIRVNAVLPGWTRTEMAEGGYQDDRFRDVTTKRTPVRRWASGDDYHSLAAYLCDRSVDFHTGDSIVFDGGYTIF